MLGKVLKFALIAWVLILPSCIDTPQDNATSSTAVKDNAARQEQKPQLTLKQVHERRQTPELSQAQEERRIRELQSMREIQPRCKIPLETAITSGVFHKIESDGQVARVWVTPIFMNSGYVDKKFHAMMVYAHYLLPHTDGVVRLIDSRTGKEVGWYSPVEFKLY